ncbi:MAG: glutathione peroxidase [Alphaproteobacteria bacterium]|nr:glutathione peroxidase [Alphaproteobacteria bacterium]MCB9792780.1 glutathione peroxidase [Alphaproteobacteria bacterium]
MARLDYHHAVNALDGTPGDLSPYADQVLLIVNTASKCGFTPQYAGLEALWKRYSGRGFAVLGFPCNQFGRQEPGTADEIAEFCEANYGVSFPMFEKVDVNGADAHPLFQQLKAAAPGLLGSQGIKWNFTKFLVGRDGEILARFGPRDTPESIAPKVEAALGG